MKKLVSFVLAMIMVLSAVSALAEAAFTPAASYDPGERAFDGGVITLVPAAGGDANNVSTDVYAGEEGKDYTDEKVYTFHDYIGALTSQSDWNPQTWETSDDSAILGMQVSSFYAIVLNSTKTGYSIVPELAADYPVDVTAEYVGQFGVKEGEVNKAWRIALRQDATWDDGTPINADDFVYSMQQQLNPKMLNRRADSWYDGDFSIVNAKNYVYAGKATYDAIPESAEDLIAEGTEVFLDMDFWGITGAPDAEGNAAPQYVSIADETLYRDEAVAEGADEDWVSAKYIFDNYLAAGAPYYGYQGDYLKVKNVASVVTWEDVGFKKVDDYTIDFILEKPVNEPAFYVPYQLSDFLVKKDLFESCKSFFKDGVAVETEEEADQVTTNYCKSLETNASYGPYILTTFQLDKEWAVSRNENWFGYKDGKHLGQYQMDNYVATVIVDHSTQMLAFEKGELDAVSLQNADMEKYAASDYIFYEPQSYTTKLTFNTDYDKLLSRGSQILVIDEFRKGFAFALDANEFATSYTASGTAGYGMLNYQYCYNPFSGELYRDSEPAKKALVNLFEMTYGEGGEYATLDEAYEAMTGYDMEKAQELMKIAADKAIEAGIWDGETEMTLEIRVYNSDDIYVQMYNYFKAQLAEAVKGSKLEGKIDMKLTVDADYYETNYSGGADMIFTTWGGAAMAPFGMMAQCYTDASDGSGNQMEFGYDTTKIMLTLDCGGEIGQLTDSLRNWTLWCNNATTEVPTIYNALGSFADYAYSTRCEVLAACEQCFMNWFTTTSLYYRNVAILHSQKVNYATYTCLPVINFGGSQFYTFNYDDAEWAEYTANNTLVY